MVSDNDNIVPFPGEFRRKRVITGREIWDSPDPSDLMVWEICGYLRGSPKHFNCNECARWDHDEKYGKTKQGCRMLAEEACRLVMAVQRKEKDAKL